MRADETRSPWAERPGSGELVVLEGAVAHEVVEAFDESACLLTLGGAS